jgi:nitrogenase molybdenum-iron protein beta chain
MYAALGIHGACRNQPRLAGLLLLSPQHAHPALQRAGDGGTSSFTEGSSVFGGQANLLQAINNIFTIYDPDVIAVHTTCLSETIGDDIPQIAEKAKDDGLIPEGKRRYPRQHAELRRLARDRLLEHGQGDGRLLRRAGRREVENRVNIIPGWVEPADMREIKRLVGLMGFDSITFPDTSGVLDARRRACTKCIPRAA